ncbi:MAG: DinB family protein [Acidobacteriota bacterium]|nr:DinB family protein [Acidobacteriota bacterium]
MTTSEALIADLEREIPLTRKVLEAVPEEHFAWKPHEKSMSLAQLAGHLAETPKWIESMLEAEMDFAEADKEYKPFVPTTRAELVEAFESYAQGCIEALRGRDDAFMEAIWVMRSGDQVIMETPRKVVIRDIVVHHSIHHRGQLTVYLRLLDVPVPGTYGPSADEQSSM